jgi:hypothetical protein
VPEGEWLKHQHQQLALIAVAFCSHTFSWYDAAPDRVLSSSWVCIQQGVSLGATSQILPRALCSTAGRMTYIIEVRI